MVDFSCTRENIYFYKSIEIKMKLKHKCEVQRHKLKHLRKKGGEVVKCFNYPRERNIVILLVNVVVLHGLGLNYLAHAY